jgi:hypothetical protein
MIFLPRGVVPSLARLFKSRGSAADDDQAEKAEKAEKV